MRFSLSAYRFTFEALDPVWFPSGLAGNTFRGAFGTILRRIAGEAYARIFEPTCAGGPSGLSDAPRPFVLRAAALDGRRFPPGSEFSIDVHDFHAREPLLPYFRAVFEQLVEAGLGSGRARVALRKVDPARTIALELAGQADGPARAAVSFTTPTELKSEGRLVERPEFGILFARIRDRISTLRQLYGEGPLEIDFRGMAERAARVRLSRCDLHWESPKRRSSRTGQVHPLGGFMGNAEYEGPLAEFLPFLETAYWTGVGRQTVWGKGEIRVVQFPRIAETRT
jgi:CRISPR-associated endoribonuclease Cas6